MAVAAPAMSAEEQSLQWFTRPLAFLTECQARFGDLFELDLAGWGRHLCVSHPDLVRRVLTAPAAELEGGSGNAPLRPLLGDASLLLLGGERHAAHRRLLTAGFTSQRVAASGPAMRRAAERALERWPVGSPFALQPALSRLSLDIILEHLLGAGARGETSAIGDLLQRLLHSGPLSLRFFESGVAAETLAELRRDVAALDALLHEALRAPRQGGLLAELGAGLAANELRDELVTLAVAGHATTSTAIAWTLAFACREPRVRDELRAAGPAYIEALCQEGLRIMPVIPVIARRACVPLELGGAAVSAGTHVMPCIYLVHRRPELYPEPERFRPERFLERRFSAWEYLPFGGGHRHCVGAGFAHYEMQSLVALITSRFELEPAQADLPEPVRNGLMVVPADGARVIARDKGNRITG